MEQFFQAIRIWMERNIPIQFNNGIVISVDGPYAQVRITGSAQPVRAITAPYLEATIGDKCILARVLNENLWVIAAVYSNNRGTISNAAVPIPQHSQGAIAAKNVSYYRGSKAAVNCDSTTYIDVIEMEFRTRTEGVTVGFNGDSFFTASATAAVDLDLTIAVDGIDAFNGEPVNSPRARATNTFAGASFSVPIKGIPPGLHTFTLQAKQSSIANAAQHALRPAQFWIADL